MALMELLYSESYVKIPTIVLPVCGHEALLDDVQGLPLKLDLKKKCNNKNSLIYTLVLTAWLGLCPFFGTREVRP